MLSLLYLRKEQKKPELWSGSNRIRHIPRAFGMWGTLVVSGPHKTGPGRILFAPDGLKVPFTNPSIISGDGLMLASQEGDVWVVEDGVFVKYVLPDDATVVDLIGVSGEDYKTIVTVSDDSFVDLHVIHDGVISDPLRIPEQVNVCSVNVFFGDETYRISTDRGIFSFNEDNVMVDPPVYADVGIRERVLYPPPTEYPLDPVGYHLVFPYPQEIVEERAIIPSWAHRRPGEF